CNIRRSEIAFNNRAADSFNVDSLAIISDGHQQHARVMPGFDADQTGLGLTCMKAFRRRLNTMIYSVAKYVVERRLNLLEHIAVDGGGFTPNFEIYLLVQRASDFADHPRKAADAITKRAHPAVEHMPVQVPSDSTEAAIELIEFGV